MTENKSIPTYRLLGKTGLRVHPINLGTMTFGSKWKTMMGETTDDDIVKIMRKYYDIGGNFIDTANVYQYGESEEKVALSLAKNNIPRGDMVIATKFSNIEQGREPNNRGNSKKSMFEAVEKSLKRLNTHYIDVYYVHFWDFTTDMKEVMRNCDELVRSGKVLHVGISDAPAWEVARGNTLAECFGWNPFSCYQGRYSLDNREAENDLVPMCVKSEMGFIPWGVLGQGKLTGTRSRENKKPEDVKRSTVNMTEQDFVIQDEVLKIAKEVGATPSQVALNWMLSRPGVPSALIGPRTYEQFEDVAKALDWKLTKEQIDSLNKVSEPAIKSIFPHTFIGNSYKTNNWLYFGGSKYQIE